MFSCRRNKTIFAIVIGLSLFAPAAAAEQLYSSTWGYKIDLPEGFTLTDKSDTGNLLLEHTMFPVSVIISVTSLENANTPQEAFTYYFDKLNATGNVATISGREDSAVSFFEMTLFDEKKKGWGVVEILRDKKGVVTLLAYASEDQFDANEHVIISVVDSLSVGSNIDKTGAITAFAYPPQGDEAVNLSIAGTNISSSIDKSDIDANEHVIEREYKVLNMYLNTPLERVAWERYYRMIYRDSYPRLEKTAFAIYSALYDEAEEEAKSSSSFSTERILAQKLLTWTQNFPYIRNQEKSDFTTLPAILKGKGSDCDSRALLLAILLSAMGNKTMIFVSTEYNHALFGIELPGKGARMQGADGISYILGETTEKVDLGLVAAEMADPAKWISIPELSR